MTESLLGGKHRASGMAAFRRDPVGLDQGRPTRSPVGHCLAWHTPGHGFRRRAGCARAEPADILEEARDLRGLDRCNPGLAVGYAVGDQQPLAIGMPGEAGSKLDPLRAKIELPAHATEHALIVEPYEPMLIEPASDCCPPLHLVNQGEPAAAERDELGAAAEV